MHDGVMMGPLSPPELSEMKSCESSYPRLDRKDREPLLQRGMTIAYMVDSGDMNCGARCIESSLNYPPCS